jgi:hypothetical protein
MGQQEQVTTEAGVGGNFVSPPAVETDSLEPHVEAALDRLCARFFEGVSEMERMAQRLELQTQLYALAAAYREIGSAPEQAVGEAANRLESALTQTRQQAAKRQSVTAHVPSARPATLLALVLFGAFYLADITRLAAILWEHVGGTNDIAFYRIEAFLVPLLAGLLVGLLAKARAARGTFNALLLLAIVAVWLPAFAFALSVTQLLPFEDSAFWKLPFWSVAPGIVGLACWPPMGLLGASLGSRLRRKASRRGAGLHG